MTGPCADEVIHGADAPWLDPCDKHRDEGGGFSAAPSEQLSLAGMQAACTYATA
jgi:hypothetical protein